MMPIGNSKTEFWTCCFEHTGAAVMLCGYVVRFMYAIKRSFWHPSQDNTRWCHLCAVIHASKNDTYDGQTAVLYAAFAGDSWYLLIALAPGHAPWSGEFSMISPTDVGNWHLSPHFALREFLSVWLPWIWQLFAWRLLTDCNINGQDRGRGVEKWHQQLQTQTVFMERWNQDMLGGKLKLFLHIDDAMSSSF